MEWLIWSGAAVSLAGVGLLVYCILGALKIRSEGGDEDAVRKKLQGMVALNLGALAVSAIGLMAVVTGIVLT